MTTFNDARVRMANERTVNRRGRYVLYWMQMFRRLHANHALDYAIHLANTLKKPLVIFEALKLHYPWASARHHTFILQGMRDNAVTAEAMDALYWPFVEPPAEPGHGLVKRLAAEACLIVTDDYPAYIVPAHNRAIAAKCEVPVHLVDGNSMVPLSRLGAMVGAAAHLRPRIHKQFAEAWANRAASKPVLPRRVEIDPPFPLWNARQDLSAFVASLSLDQSVPAVATDTGGSVAGWVCLKQFIEEKLPHYAEGRNQPDAPKRGAASQLSAYLHYGHLAIQEVVEAVLGNDWTPEEIEPRGGRADFFTRDSSVNSYLDEAITWRDVGYQWHYCRNVDSEVRSAESKNVSWLRSPLKQSPMFNFESFDFSPGGERTLDVVLPEWVKATLRKHEVDRRDHLYSLEEFENAETHDDLWNAAQTELVATGRIHNYLRMLWGKKVLEWSATPAEAYRVLEHLNNKYALDGRDPNSYTGILWCLGLFDRPWAPERPVFGTVRFMSSENTAKKFKLTGYYQYIRTLPTVAEIRGLT